MTHAINSNIKLLSIDITRARIEMIKSWRGETESRKKKKKKKVRKMGIKENKRKENLKKKERKKKKKSTNNLKINKTEMKNN